MKLGWHVDAMPRGVRECAQGRECGYCGLGCRVGAKQSVVKTWLARRPRRRHATRSFAPRCSGCCRVRRGAGDRRAHRRGPPPHRPRPGGDRRPAARSTRRRCCVARACEREHRPPPEAASGDGRLRRLRRGAEAMGRGDASPLLRSVSRSARRLRPQVRDRGRTIRTCSSRSARGAARASTSSDGGDVEHGADRGAAAGSGRRARCESAATASRSSTTRSRRSTPITFGPGSTEPPQILEASGAKRIFSSQTKWVGYEPGAPGRVSGSWPMPTPPAMAPDSCSWARSTSWARRAWVARRRCRPAIRRPDLGCPRPLRVRRLRLPQRVRSESPDLDPGDRPHGRSRAGGEVGLNGPAATRPANITAVHAARR